MAPNVKKFFFDGWVSFLVTTFFGIFRLAVGSSLEYFVFGLPAAGIVEFRAVSWGLDGILSWLFVPAWEKVYGVANRDVLWQRVVVDTLFITAYKDLSYAVCLWAFFGLDPQIFLSLLAINTVSFIVTGGLNCWAIKIVQKKFSTQDKK